MTTQMALTSPHPRRLLRSTVAVLSGFLAVVFLSLGTDQVLHVLEVYPPWGQPMHDAGLNLLALAYRTAYTIFGGYFAARLAPYAPMRHAFVLGVLGLAVGLAGAIVETDAQRVRRNYLKVKHSIDGMRHWDSCFSGSIGEGLRPSWSRCQSSINSA